MEPHHLKKIDLHVALSGLTLSLCAVFFWDSQIIFGTLIGSTLAILNWLAFRSLTKRFLSGVKRSRLAILLVLKTSLIFGAVAVAIIVLPIDAIAFIVGLSSLVIGISTHSVWQALSDGENALKEDM